MALDAGLLGYEPVSSLDVNESDIAAPLARSSTGELATARVVEPFFPEALISSQTAPTENVPEAVAEYGVSGAGLTVGIISDSFNITDPVTAQAPNGDNMAFDIANGELPAATTILKDGATGEGNMDEGRAIGQLVHDIAPNAALDFYAAGESQQDMANAILALAQAGCKVIVDDIAFLDEPAYQDGIIAQTINQVVQQYGVVYLSAAGNEGWGTPQDTDLQGWQGAANFQSSPTTLHYSASQLFSDPNVHSSQAYLQQFASGEAFLPITAYFSSQQVQDKIPTDVEVSLEWNQPYAHATSQIDLLVQDATTGQLLPADVQGTSADMTNGEAVQIVDFQPVSGHQYRLLVADMNPTAAAPTDLKLVVFSDDYVVVGDSATTAAAETTSTIFGHSTAQDAIAVGAAYYQDTPAYGVNPAQAEYFTSTGTDMQDFDAKGNPLSSPEYTHGVDITAADGGDTTYFPEYPLQDTDTDGDGYPNFYGTSAAVADAGGITALVLGVDPNLTAAQIEGLLEITALPMPATAQSGAGLVQADQALHLASIVAGSGLTPLFGTSGADTLTATGSGEILIGGPGSDTLSAPTGNNTLYGGAGSNTLSGGTGVDTALYEGLLRDYTVNMSAGSGTVAGGPEGSQDTLTSIDDLKFFDGTLTFDPHSASAEVYRMYDTAFSRAPDFYGGQNWTQYLENGGSLQSLADTFAASPEFQADIAGKTNQQIVDYMYENTLHRAPDPGGEADWTAYLDSGHTIGDLVLAFSESAEHVSNTMAAVNAGFWDLNPAYETTEFMYQATFGRVPDEGGLISWATEVENGLSLQQMASDFVSSTEFQSDIAGMSNQQIVDFLYQTALHRSPDPGGEANWTAFLNNGGSVANLVLQFEQSNELHNLVVSQVDHGALFV